MITNSEIKSIIINNFNDIRISSIHFFIDFLIKRNNHGGNISQYRIKNILTDNYVTSLADFVSAINDRYIIADYYHGSEKMGGDRTHPFLVILTNFKVELNTNCEEDSKYITSFGKQANSIMFLINYIADGDSVLPLKIFEVKLA